MSSINNSANISPLGPLPKLPQATARGNEPTGGGSLLSADSLKLSGSQPTGGASVPTDPTQYAQFVADTIAMLNSPDVRQRYQAIINMTKMAPAEAIPLLERAVKNDNPQVVQLAQRALDVMKQASAQAAPAAPAAPATPAAPSVASVATVPTAPTPAATPTPPAAPSLFGNLLTPTAPTPAAPTPATPSAATVVPSVPPAATPLPAPTLPAAPTGTPRSVAELASLLAGPVSEGDALRAIGELGNASAADRQAAINTLLTWINVGDKANHATPATIAAAIRALTKLKSTEATPFIQAVLANSTFGTDANIRAAAMEAGQTGSTGTVGALSTTQAPASALTMQTLREKALKAMSTSEGLSALAQLEPYITSNRQDVLNVLLNVINVGDRNNLSTPPMQTVAVNMLARMKASEATPFLQAILADSSTNDELKSATRQALAAQSAPAAAPAAPPAAPAAQAASTPAAGTTGTQLPSFLRK